MTSKHYHIDNLSWFQEQKLSRDIGEKDIFKKVCSHFACGKELSLMEKLFGDKCIEHSERIIKPYVN